MAGSLLTNVEAALRDPASIFKEPMDVVNHPAFNVDMKMKVLEQWERDARTIATAESKGVIRGETDMLSRVRQAMRSMNDRADPHTHAATGVDVDIGEQFGAR